MNILIINGSPKGERSNSLKLTQAFVCGLQEQQTAFDEETKVEQLDVCKLHIEGCKGCFACWNATPGKCCVKDDMVQVLEKILWADIILYSFPLYYFNVPGTLKNLIDRQLPMVLPFMSERTDGVGSGSHDARYDMSKKRYVLISTCGFYSAEGNYDSVLKMFDHICGNANYEYIFCGQGELFRVKELSGRTEEYLQIVKRAGGELAGGSITEDTQTELKQLLYPREVFEKMADASWGVSKESGEKEDESLVFTRQMAALYNKKHYDGKDRVLEMCYTDLGKTYQIALTKDGSSVVTDESLSYTTRIETPYSVWVSIAQNEIRGDEALAKQMYRVMGDFSLMIQWDKFFGPDTAEAADVKAVSKNARAKRHPIMVTMLIPWITLWVAVSIHTELGALITIAVCACLPLLFARYEMTIYDKWSMAMVPILSMYALMTARGAWASNIGYLLFGLLWLGSCLTKEPLCAAYVKYDYNGDDALKNPIFMKTNYILAAAWGILYVTTAIWTWFIHQTEFVSVIMIINNIMPILMGIFTAWFQNWYPAWVAGGRKKR